MKFGVRLPTYWSNYDRTDLSTALVGTARTAQALDYTSLWANDTVIVTEEDEWSQDASNPVERGNPY